MAKTVCVHMRWAWRTPKKEEDTKCCKMLHFQRDFLRNLKVGSVIYLISLLLFHLVLRSGHCSFIVLSCSSCSYKTLCSGSLAVVLSLVVVVEVELMKGPGVQYCVKVC